MTAATPAIEARPLRPTDLGRIAVVGIRTRKLRASLSALGIAIGVAAIVAVLGLSASSESGLLAEINALGTNLLTVTNGQSLFGQTAELPTAAPAMIGRIGPVYAVQYTGSVTANVFRSPLIPSIDTNALSVDATSLALPSAVDTSVARGRFLNAATATEPVCVLGAAAAQRLGIDHVYSGERIWLDNMWFYVAGILKPAPLTPEIDSEVLVGFAAAEKYLGFDGHPSEIYLKADTSQVASVDSVLAATANPEAPNEVDVSQPSSALVAQADAQSALNGLFLGLGAVALLVGAVGVANIMVISVLERRSEIGLRRALGATRGHILTQFLSEAILLSLLGGAVGILLGVISTAVYASTKHWGVVIPPLAWGGGIGASIVIGAIAGLWPALRGGAALADRGALERLMRQRRTVGAATSMLLLFAGGMLAAACEGSATPGVANVGSSTSSTVAGGVKGNSGSPPTAQQLAAMTKFAECARAHGEPKFPDPPYANGELNSLGFRKGSPQMDKATSECHADALAAGVLESQQEIQQHLQQLLKVSKCMQAHGIADFPDPTAKGGLALSPSIVNNPGYATAAQACGAPPGVSAAPGGGKSAPSRPAG